MPKAVRVGSAVGILVSGVTHLWSYSHGYGATPVGPVFLVDGILSAVVGAAMLSRGSRGAAWAGSTLAAAALLGYAAARTVGLLGFVERAWNAASLLAAGCEAAVLVILVSELMAPDEG